ncbi:sigma-70 family RNA polymerase sigma factor [Candidatus Poribacteria bacterium]|nr:sigma-70 family RNA polymerase sigma factor [Candidatus Poribacteria bacterium]
MHRTLCHSFIRGDLVEREDDVQLIQRTLSGDDAAFGILLQRYQKSVHALVWRKLGDFHIAEDITQDTFLQAYKKLSTLKNHNQFAGWLYVIADRLCIDWSRKRRLITESLEDTPVEEVERSSYIHHVSEARETERTEHRRELVKKLLAKLPESERTVVTLYYLGEMTAKEIGKFLGVSVGTIKSRLRRGRKRLQEDEELMIQEVFGGVRIPTSLGENVMRQVADMKPTPAPVSKPFLPWMALGAAAVLVVLLLGASNRYLTRFQKPYSFESQSEPTIEIVDAPIVLDIPAKPAVRNQVGRGPNPGKTSRAGSEVSNVISTSIPSENATQFSTAQWMQGNGPPAGPVRNIFAMSDRTVYAIIQTGIYRLTADATAWTRLDAGIPIGESLMPMAAHSGRLYIVAADEIFASDNRGETWITLGPRPKGDAVELVITDAEEASSSQVSIAMYLALRDSGIFRSTDGGAQWTPLNDGLTGEKISAVAAVRNTVFAATENGLYRLDSDIWGKLPLDTSGVVCSLAVSGHNVYAGIGHKFLVRLTPSEMDEVMRDNRWHFAKIFHSTDLGASWTEIWHENQYLPTGPPAGITVLATGKTLLALGLVQSRSIDGGQTWTELGSDLNFRRRSRLPAVIVNEKTCYKANLFSIHRTTDGGASWHLFMNGMTGTLITDVVAFGNRLYAHNGYEVYQSTDAGVSWKIVPTDRQKAGFSPFTTSVTVDLKLIVVGNILYYLFSGGPTGANVGIFRLSTDGDRFTPVQGVPIFDRYKLADEKYKSKERDYRHVSRLRTETAAASRNVFYIEYIGELFKWKLGDPEWTSTGLIEDNHSDTSVQVFTLAVSGETVYAGKWDGKLFQSLDEGKSWRDVTPTLPIRLLTSKI